MSDKMRNRLLFEKNNSVADISKISKKSKRSVQRDVKPVRDKKNEIRRIKIMELIKKGHSQTKIGEILNMSRQQVSRELAKIKKVNPPPSLPVPDDRFYCFQCKKKDKVDAARRDLFGLYDDNRQGLLSLLFERSYIKKRYKKSYDDKDADEPDEDERRRIITYAIDDYINYRYPCCEWCIGKLYMKLYGIKGNEWQLLDQSETRRDNFKYILKQLDEAVYSHKMNRQSLYYLSNSNVDFVNKIIKALEYTKLKHAGSDPEPPYILADEKRKILRMCSDKQQRNPASNFAGYDLLQLVRELNLNINSVIHFLYNEKVKLSGDPLLNRSELARQLFLLANVYIPSRHQKIRAHGRS